MRKFRIPMASLEDSHNVKRVEEDRTIAIEAAIVRIMKVRLFFVVVTTNLNRRHRFLVSEDIVASAVGC